MLTEKAPDPTAKTRTWTLPAILGLALGVLGAVGIIELRPQMLVSPQEQIEKSQPFSAPFRIDNTGYLSFYVANVFCYVHEVTVGSGHISEDSIYDPEWDNISLDRAEGGTTICAVYRGPTVPTTADIAIAIDYKPFRSFPHRPFRKYFRFRGRYIDNWQWTRQPSAEIEADADKQIDHHIQDLTK